MNGLDTILFELVNQSWTTPFLDHFMPVISTLDLWIPLFLVAVAGVLIFGGKQGRLFLLSLLVGLALGEGVLSHGLKHLLGRPRPRDVLEGTIVRSIAPGHPKWLHAFEPPLVVVSHPVEDHTFHGNSMPSSHVVNVFMLATVAFCFSRRTGYVLAVGGLLVAWSRVYCGAHWPSDLPPSILLGIFSGYVSFRLVTWADLRLRKPARES